MYNMTTRANTAIKLKSWLESEAKEFYHPKENFFPFFFLFIVSIGEDGC